MISFDKALLAAGALLALGLAGTARADDCSSCHEQTVHRMSVHASMSCADCHLDVNPAEHPDDMFSDADLTPAKGDAVCATCHDREQRAVGTGVHAGILGCTQCHGPAHEIPPVSYSAGRLGKTAQLSTCGQCHEEVSKAFVDTGHGRGLLLAGLTVAPTCSDCHGGHAIAPASDPGSMVSPRRDPETCGTCHAGVFVNWRDASAHGAGWKERSDDTPVCSSCHAAHPRDLVRGQVPRVEAAENCGSCHEGALKTYRESFHGRAAHLGMVSAAQCADCHSPHNNLPASDERSPTNPDNLLSTCQSCHPEAGAGFTSYISHPNYSKEQNTASYWVHLGMTWLLILVFGSFGIHGALWLQRSAVALFRGERSHTIDTSGPWVRRFSQPHRWVHFTIILTFLTLAATGLPMKFHAAPWAQALNELPGILGVMRFLHRVAAVFTFGYAFFHVGHLLHKIFVKKERRILFGRESMVPRVQDIVDAFQNVRYFLYLGPPPKLDRWSYWEKFDYFAVFWGVPIIGLSGILLWFPEWFTQVLPGWTINVAFLVHSHEALLATGFIFIIHFFHTHMRPESFPLDPVMFVGGMPLERFKEERPLEYEHAVQSGKLDEMLMPAPSTFQLRTVYAFGFLALLTGLMLAGGIISGLLTSY